MTFQYRDRCRGFVMKDDECGAVFEHNFRIRLERMFGFDGESFVAYFWHTSFAHLSFGLHVCLSAPNIEIHVPFGFFRIGRRDQ